MTYSFGTTVPESRPHAEIHQLPGYPARYNMQQVSVQALADQGKATFETKSLKEACQHFTQRCALLKKTSELPRPLLCGEGKQPLRLRRTPCTASPDGQRQKRTITIKSSKRHVAWKAKHKGGKNNNGSTWSASFEELHVAPGRSETWSSDEDVPIGGLVSENGGSLALGAAERDFMLSPVEKNRTISRANSTLATTRAGECDAPCGWCLTGVVRGL